ncbi:MAG TPA: hypothetical protein VFO90_09630 [Terrimicrobiaceae bacterium]|jgi:hypothetical protein|nr:hypothetical protein [Terrimicrobiaceae bacterium]
MKDDLHGLLKTWQPEVQKPQAFKREVWGRIERLQSGHGMFERFLVWFNRPQIASAAAALSVLGGAWIGFAWATQDGHAAYLRSVDPYAQVLAR